MPSYKQLLQQAEQDIEALDFDALRRAYVERKDYNPYGAPPSVPELREAVEQEDWPAVAAIGTALLKGDVLQPHLHSLTGYAFGMTGDLQRAAWHRIFAAGLLNAILRSGNGRTVESAFQVVHIREEYDTLNFLRLEPVGQALSEHDGRFYDVITVNGQNGEPVGELYFEVTSFMRRVADDS